MMKVIQTRYLKIGVLLTRLKFCLFNLTIFFSVKLLLFSYPSVLTYVLGAQKIRLIEAVLLSTHNICFG